LWLGIALESDRQATPSSFTDDVLIRQSLIGVLSCVCQNGFENDMRSSIEILIHQ